MFTEGALKYARYVVNEKNLFSSLRLFYFQAGNSFINFLKESNKIVFDDESNHQKADKRHSLTLHMTTLMVLLLFPKPLEENQMS